ncbi:MAG TPA: HoxN/HupN/NixA family nickel/cobalt transporter [Candidatus Tumulicola sp.]|jgi:high-affinity nickel-transport protein
MNPEVAGASSGFPLGKVYATYAGLIALNIGAWVLAFVAFSSHPLLLGTALLAYTFGLRHAVDADHISAIDNVTRKMMQDGQRPVGVGLFFSLGHSTIVVALSIGVACGAAYVRHAMPSLESTGAVVGACVSATFLLIVAALNAFVLADIVRAFRRLKRGASDWNDGVDDALARRGIMGRFFGSFVKLVDRSWKMYPVGVLFGLGFDTATEVALLGIAAVEASKGLPVYDILIFPLLFTAGMSLLDTTDGILMLGAYGWAFVKPMRKLYYNMVITLVSVLVAVAVGVVELAGIVADRFNLTGGFWSAIGRLNDNWGELGFLIIGVFIASWAISAVVYRVQRYDEFDAQLSVARE